MAIELSIVVTAHNEGILLHKALNSVFCAADELDRKKITYEVIVHIDNGDSETISVAKRYPSIMKRKIRILNNDFGNLSKSRNFAASVASGKYVAFLDGDDYISKNWYLNAINELKRRSRDCIIYPEAVLTFQDNKCHVLQLLKKYTGKDKDFLTILSGNCYTSVVMAKKKVFLDTPYLLMGEGYCYEDYVFNVQTLEKNIPHLVAPGTVMFYRKSDNSMLSRANGDGLVLPRMNLFELGDVKKKFLNKLFYDDRLDNIDIDEPDNKAEVELVEGRRTFRDNFIYKKIRGNWFLNYLITPFLRLALRIKKKLKPDDTVEQEESIEDDNLLIPDFVIEQWREINKIDIRLYPTKVDLENTSIYDVACSVDIGRSYIELSKSFRRLPNYVFIVPWVVKGGADKVMLNYLKVLHMIHPDWHFAVITTLNEKRVWLEDVPDYVDLYELGKFRPYLSCDGAETLLTRLLVQLNCKKIHIINSELGYEWVRKHKLLVKAEYMINVSLFSDEKIKEWDGGIRISSYESPGVFEIFSNTSKVFSDNMRYLDVIEKRNGFDKDKLKVHYQPIDLPINAKKQLRKKTKKILWAGRIVPVKMPKLVMEISELLDGIQIDMYGELNKDIYSEQDLFENATNVNYCGSYSGFNELPTEDYDLFLYTSETDGLPNTILEAAAAGLPIVASNDGGVGDFIIHGKTGILVEDFYKPEEYARLIKDIYNDKFDLERIVLNAQRALREKHSWTTFTELVQKDIG